MPERQTLSILFYLRRDKVTRKNQAPIYMRITVNGRRSEMATYRYIELNKWNKEGGYVKGTKAEIKGLNEYLDILRSKVYQAQRELLEDNKAVTALALRNSVQGKTGIQKTLFEVFQYHNKLMSEQVPAQYSPTTLVRFNTTMKHVEEFVKYKYHSDDMYLSQLNHEFITSLEHYFKVIRKCNHNTTIKYIKNLKKVINLAVKNDWINKDPFRKISLKVKPVKRDFLDADELAALENTKLKVPRLDQVRDIFIFSCYTGLAYVDVSELTENNIRKGIDGELWIYTNRAKTSTKSNIPLLPQAIAIIKKYKDYSENAYKNRLLPTLSNQKMNAYLKEIADLADITKNLTFHLARHTFATTVTLTNDVPIESVSKMLGHKSMRTTQIYAKVLDQKVGLDMQRLKEKYSENKSKKEHNP